MLHNLLLNISQGTIEWSRAQFALTAAYHWLFVPLTLGLAVVMGIMETIYYRKRTEFWKSASQFWQRLFGVNFAMGVATGIILEFEFGTNWSNYSWFVGDIFGAPLAIEGIVAFFMESTFVAVMFFGWHKVSAGFHLASTWLTGLGATISAWWILVANAWMQYPVGCTFNPDTMRHEMTSFMDVALSPAAVDKFCHTVTSSWIIGAIFVVAVSGWYLLKKRHDKLARASIKVGAAVGLTASVLAAITGHNSGMVVAETQPMKLAAMEALYVGGSSQPITMVSWVSPFGQPDYMNEEEPPYKIDVPYGLSILATGTLDGYVPGVRDIINGYTRPDGSKEPSVEEKMKQGREAITALAAYRKAKTQAREAQASGNTALEQSASAEAQKQYDILMPRMKYFGYGYVREPSQVVPNIPLNFWAFRIMVGMGMVFIAFFALVLFLSYKKDIGRMRWVHKLGILLVPLAYVASEAGWMVAEMGRQPWTIQDMLPTWVAVSDVESGSVALTFFLFLILFTTMLLVELNILRKQIQKGPSLPD